MKTITQTNKLFAAFAFAALFTVVIVPLVSSAAMGSVPPPTINNVPPSTNDLNRTNGWAYVDVASTGVGEIDLTLTNERGFLSCFEYRTDGDTSQSSGANYNINVTDGLYPFVCLNNDTQPLNLTANEYVEVRMVFGAESDERFDWTRFDVLPEPFDRTATITAPTAGEEVAGVVDFAATLNDKDGNDNAQWAVRTGSCGGTTVAGNVDGFSSSYAWDGADFTSTVDMTTLAAGDYCFVFNPTESAGDVAIRLTQNFTLAAVVVEPTDPMDKNQCKKGGYEDFGFKNQGQCIRFVETGKDSR